MALLNTCNTFHFNTMLKLNNKCLFSFSSFSWCQKNPYIQVAFAYSVREPPFLSLPDDE